MQRKNADETFHACTFIPGHYQCRIVHIFYLLEAFSFTARQNAEPETMAILALSTLLAIMTGFAIKQGNICAVAALHQWVAIGDALHFRTLITGICCAGLVLLGSAWCFPDTASVSPNFSVTWLTVLGGALFGAGAWINGACVLGTIASLCRGDSNFLGTIVGMFLGALVGQYINSPTLLSHAASLTTSTLTTICVAGFYASIIISDRWFFHRPGLRKAAGGNANGGRDLLPMIAVVGVCCGALHALNGEWTYLSAASRLAQRLTTSATEDTLTNLTLYTGAMFLGGLTSAWRRGELSVLSPTFRIFSLKLIGGFTMGFAAGMIPGGNESMMFYGIPSLATHAIVAYATMTTTLLIVTRAHHKRMHSM